MADPSTENKLAPPYVAYGTLRNFVDSLRNNELPTRVDKTLMKNLSYGSQAALLAALKFLKLVSDEGTPTPVFAELVKADEAVIGTVKTEILKGAYPYLWASNFDLSRASPGELVDQLRTAAEIKGSTVEKVVSFFLAAARDAGVKLSPHVSKEKGASNGGAKRARAKRKTKPEVKVEHDQVTLPKERDEPWLAKYPDFDPSWSADLQKSWFDGYNKLMAMKKRATS